MDDHTVRIRALLAAGASLEDMLGLLRRLGFSKGRTMFFLTEDLGMDGDEVPGLVHRSQTWSDRFEVDAKVSSDILALLDSVRTEPGDGPVDLTNWLKSRTEEPQS
jgi:hypothetical protein